MAREKADAIHGMSNAAQASIGAWDDIFLHDRCGEPPGERIGPPRHHEAGQQREQSGDHSAADHESLRPRV